jgi:hypothetical protein
MSLSRTDLWQRLADYTPGPQAAPFGFIKRLSQENGWSHAYSRRVLSEYRRFAYLACIAPQIMTPPDAVDQVWHLHLTYSRDYWQRFCPQVLGSDLHHGPTEGGGAERRRYLEAYQATLALYAEEFGSKPPEDIWPEPKARFASPQRFQRLDTSRYVMMPKTTVAIGGLIGVGLLLSGCKVLGADLDDFVPFAIMFVMIYAAVMLRKITQGPKSKKDGSGCSSSSSGCSSSTSSDSGSHHSSHSSSHSGDSNSDSSSSSGGDSGCGGGGGD